MRRREFIAGLAAAAWAGKAICGQVTVTKRIDSTSPIRTESSC
jgi:hypothetical protein